MNHRYAVYSFCIVLFLFVTGACMASPKTPDTLPNCLLTDKGGKSFAPLQELKGNVLYVDFWASWCPPCLKSFPFMNALHREFSGRGLQVIAVNVDEQLDDAYRFMTNSPSDFSVVFDNANRDCAQAFALKAMPSTYLIDRQGKIRHVHLGFKSDETAKLRSWVEQLLAE